MTTVLDPSGSASVYYNKSGSTSVAVSAAGTSQGSAASIPRSSEVTIVRGSTSSGNYGLSLPTSADVGDLVEVYAVNTDPDGFLTVYAVSGDTLNGGSGSSRIVLPSFGVQFRKVTASDWRSVGGTN